MGALDYRDRIGAMVEQKPVQPTAVAKELMTNSMLSSAMLSEMSEKGLVKVSHLKVGSSPLYYHPGHPEHLLDYVQHLNEKDRRTVAALKEKSVMRDTVLDPLTRVSLRNIKDFAKPLDVSINGMKELFWKFYLLTDEQAAEHIKAMLQPEKPAEQAPAEQKAAKPRKPRAKKPKIAVEPQTQLQKTETVAPQAPAIAAKEPATAPAAPAVKAPVAKPVEEQKPILPAEAASQALEGDDPFLQKLMGFFASNNITILEQVALKKKNEYDFVLSLASPVGQLHYYCKAKNKTKVGEADLSHAFVQGQLKKLPILFLSPGTLTKPATDLMKELKGLTVKQV